MSKQVEVIEVGPRDGFQSVKCTPITTEQKLTVIDQLVAAGVKHIEYTSFVSPKAIPQLADAADVTRVVLEKYPDMDLFALIPNLRGAQNAYELGLRRVCYVVSLSKSHNKANINRTHEQSLEELSRIYTDFPEADLCVELATVFGCPFEGIPEISKVVDFVARIYALGCRSICLADTIGIADPRQVRPSPALPGRCTSTTPGAWAWSTPWPPSKAASPPCSPPWAAWAAAPSPPEPPAIPPRRTWCICSSAWAMRPASTLTSCWPCRNTSTPMWTAFTADTSSMSRQTTPAAYKGEPS